MCYRYLCVHYGHAAARGLLGTATVRGDRAVGQAAAGDRAHVCVCPPPDKGRAGLFEVTKCPFLL